MRYVLAMVQLGFKPSAPSQVSKLGFPKIGPTVGSPKKTAASKSPAHGRSNGNSQPFPTSAPRNSVAPLQPLNATVNPGIPMLTLPATKCSSLRTPTPNTHPDRMSTPDFFHGTAFSSQFHLPTRRRPGGSWPNFEHAKNHMLGF